MVLELLRLQRVQLRFMEPADDLVFVRGGPVESRIAIAKAKDAVAVGIVRGEAGFAVMIADWRRDPGRQPHWPALYRRLGGRPALRHLAQAGLAKGVYDERIDDTLELVDCRIANSVRCVPPQNKPEPSEIKTCRQFLKSELEVLPNVKVILALGKIAHDSVLTTLGAQDRAHPFKHGVAYDDRQVHPDFELSLLALQHQYRRADHRNVRGCGGQGEEVGGALSRDAADRLDIVAIRIEDKGAVVILVIVRARTGWAVVGATGLERGGVKSVHLGAGLCREGDMRAGHGLAGAEPEIGLPSEPKPAAG